MSSEWREIIAQDGRKYYHNLVTKQTTWEKPNVLKTTEELSCDWTEYFNKEGKPYYYNSKTKKSQWEKPKEYIEMLEKKKSKEEQDGSQVNKLGELFQTHNLKLPPNMASFGMNQNTLPYQGGYNQAAIQNNPLNPLTEIDQKLREIEEKRKLSALEIEKLSKEDIEKLFKDMLRRAGVSSTWKWEDCQRVLQTEEIWKAVKTFSQKRSLFNEFIKECKIMEREELKLKREKLKLKFRQMLEEDNSLTSDTKFAKIIMKFCHDERWRAIDEREREELFQDYLDELEKRENEERKIIRETKRKNFRKVLEEKKLPSTTKWKDILLNFKDDPLFVSMEKIDRLRTFTDYISELEKIEKEEKENTKRFIEYRNRENFRELLQEKLDKKALTSETKWKNFVYEIKNSVEYLNLIGQDGSQPKDLFDDVIYSLKENYKKNKEVLKKILKQNQIKFAHETTFDQFDEKLRSIEEYMAIDPDMKMTLYTHLIKKLKDKEKHNSKIEKKSLRKLESHFLKKKIKIYFEDESEGSETKESKELPFEDVLAQVREHTRFASLSDEKVKEIYERMKVILSNEDYVANLNRDKDDTSSESGQIKKKKSKKKKNKKRREEESLDRNRRRKPGDGVNSNMSNLYLEELKKANRDEEKEDGEVASD